MIDTIARLMDRAHVMVAHLYAERQIYLRSHGHVQFISLSPIAQIGMAAIAVGFLSELHPPDPDGRDTGVERPLEGGTAEEGRSETG